MQMVIGPSPGKGDGFHQLHTLDLYLPEKEQPMVSLVFL